MQFYRCPWCGEPLFKKSQRRSLRRRGRQPMHCPYCGKSYAAMEVKRPLLSAISKLALDLTGALLTCTLIVSLLYDLRYRYLYGKSAQVDQSNVMLLVAFYVSCLLFFLLLLINTTKLFALTRLEDTSGRVAPFMFSFSVRLTTSKGRGRRPSKRWIHDFTICSALFGTGDSEAQQVEIPLVLDRVRFNQRAEVECDAGFLTDQTYQQLAFPGAHFTLVEGGRPIADGLVLRQMRPSWRYAAFLRSSERPFGNPQSPRLSRMRQKNLHKFQRDGGRLKLDRKAWEMLSEALSESLADQADLDDALMACRRDFGAEIAEIAEAILTSLKQIQTDPKRETLADFLARARETIESNFSRLSGEAVDSLLHWLAATWEEQQWLKF